MNVRILGPRILVRVYEWPETSSGGIILPDSHRRVYDGKLFEVVAVGERVRESLCVVADLGETLAVALTADVDGEPLDLQPDDIIRTRGMFKGEYSPELTAFFGTNVWFINAVEGTDDNLVSAIECVWPSRNWKEEAA